MATVHCTFVVYLHYNTVVYSNVMKCTAFFLKVYLVAVQSIFKCSVQSFKDNKKNTCISADLYIVVLLKLAPHIDGL